MDNKTDTSRMKAILVVAATLAFMCSPLLTSGFNGFTPDQFPIPQVDPPVQPAGYAFSIWGLIYIWLGVSAVFGLLRRAQDREWDAMRWPLIVSLGVGAAWIPVAQVSVALATVMIWIMLGAALVALARAPRGNPWLCEVPLALYAGWLTAASCVALGLVAAGFGWLGAGQVIWALVALVIAVTIAGTFLTTTKRAPFYGAAVIWALIGVLVQNLTGGSVLVGILAVLGMIAVAVMSLRNLSDWS
ncbi:hypothetical protein SAMN05421688_0643 [Poseidonocella pacifica]|uniref:TspO and MBR related proteins n=1 Tax=Poseidonocella pacifica TaxID=871651 RepID=A0A1I0VHD3_9RHOB|nr:hypothetical protein [Poseidonocella pacifica]SFA75795.1 hypothetical protein SAMN05421688_0643 [Poseidonocella pacifica]